MKTMMPIYFFLIFFVIWLWIDTALILILLCRTHLMESLDIKYTLDYKNMMLFSFYK